MDFKLVFVLGCLFFAGVAIADEYNDGFDYSQSDESETSEIKEGTSDEETQIVEDLNDETSMALATKEQDADAQKHKGLCHWGVAIWYKPGFAIRCTCMRCVCQVGGNWACNYHFPFCPYYYCGNQLYNPLTQICCCGKVHAKRASFACCGYFQYDTRISQCCNYYSVKPKKAVCPRFKI